MRVEIPEELREILEEFLVEAEEILEGLDQDLIDLENNPTDKELLNKIFRGMHTLKGGAGFLNLTPIVEIAHRIEDIFNKLRNDEMTLTPDLMDIILEGIDHLKSSIQMLKESEELPDMEEIEPVLKKLDSALKGEAEHLSSETTGQSSSNEEETQGGDVEFEFIQDVSEALKELIKKFPGKNLAELLEEIILMPPDSRPMEVIPEIEKLIEEGKDINDIVRVKKKEKKKEEKTPAGKQQEKK